jgi:hypothetical protein
MYIMLETLSRRRMPKVAVCPFPLIFQLCSKSGMHVGYPDEHFPWFFSVLPCSSSSFQCRGLERAESYLHSPCTLAQRSREALQKFKIRFSPAYKFVRIKLLCFLINYIYIRISKKQIYPRNMLWRPIGLWDVKDPTLSRQSAQRWR